MVSYETIIEEAIRAEMEVVGDGVAVAVARNVSGLEVADDGAVTSIEGSGQEALERVLGTYMQQFGGVSASLIARRLERELDLEGVELPPALRSRINVLQRRNRWKGRKGAAIV